MKIRKGAKKDFNGIFELVQGLWPKEKLGKRETRKIFIQQLKSGKVFIVAEEGSNFLGVVSLSVKLDIQNSGKMGWIDELVVREENKGRGVGRKLMESVRREAKKKGCLELYLYSSKKRKGAHKFYRKLGFKDTALFFWKELK